MSEPPKSPSPGSSFEEQAEYMDKTISWIKSEIRKLQIEDKKLVRQFTSMISSINNLKRFEDTSQEQMEILHDLSEPLDEAPHHVDLPAVTLHSEMDKPIQRKISNMQRYKRVGGINGKVTLTRCASYC